MKRNDVFREAIQCSDVTGIHDAAAATIDAEIKRVRNHFYLRPERREAFDSLAACVRWRTHLLRPTSGRGRPGWVGPVFLINRLRNLAERESLWLRSCQEWRPTGQSLRLEFRSLALHLLALYPVPGFMDSVWDLPPGPEAFRQHVLYIRLARGKSFRDLNLPLQVTRRIEHYVRQAPDHYTVAQALRYGETLGLGGSTKLAREIAAGRLAEKLEHCGFWRTVILFFVNHPQMEVTLVNPIIEFIQSNKFAGEEIVTSRGTGHRRAPWPDFSIRGRTPASMLRLLQEWNVDLTARKPSQLFSWPESPIPGFRFEEKRNPDGSEPREWSIQELVTSADLFSEGRALRHCVYTYAPKCRRGETTIWSLRLRVDGKEKRMATIEVDPSKGQIMQTRAKRNTYAGEHSRQIIRQWAESAGLKMNPRSW